MDNCIHVNLIKNRNLFKNIHLLRDSFIFKTTNSEIIQEKYSKCFYCNEAKNPSFACLECASIFCEKHSFFHAKKLDHILFLDIRFGQLFCVYCQNYIYIPEVGLRNPLGNLVDPNSLYFIRKYAKEIFPSTNFGIRGMANLNNTCYISCVLQALLHIPLIRNFFLSGIYSCCYGAKTNCIICGLHDLFQNYYNGTRDLFIPTSIMGRIWLEDAHFATGEQHDAHEFFINFKNMIHRNFIVNHARLHDTPLSDDSSCSCFIDISFTGAIQSEIACDDCQTRVSKTVDPFCDLSLEITVPEDTIIKKDHSSSCQVSTDYPISLENCLKRFTKVESLAADTKRFCTVCNTITGASKELKISKLPLIITTHLKRFNHKTSANRPSSLKVVNHINFYEKLDMRPFLSKESQNTKEDTNYTLCCVINHQGNTMGGHYTCYISDDTRSWFFCNDDKVCAVDTRKVLDSEAYLLFYQKDLIPYQ